MSGQYRVILADPPWSYQRTRGHGVAASHYRTLPLDAIKALPVPALAGSNAALFLWTTMSLLREGFEVVSAWGFEYRTCAFTWVKKTRAGLPYVGLGHYTRQNAEVCLLGIRGAMKRIHADVSSVLLTPRREHSRKPDEQYERIMRLFDGPYLELFARQQWPGWDVWGNEAGKFPAQPFLIGEGAA